MPDRPTAGARTAEPPLARCRHCGQPTINTHDAVCVVCATCTCTWSPDVGRLLCPSCIETHLGRRTR